MSHFDDGTSIQLLFLPFTAFYTVDLNGSDNRMTNGIN